LRATRQKLLTPRILGASIFVLGCVGAGVAVLAVGKPMLAPAGQVSEAVARPDAVLATASADMVAPPFGTPLALMADPRQLREQTIRGIADYEASANDAAQVAAMRRIHAAANLGYGPARDLILANFTSGRVIRIVVPVPDAIRYAMDAFASGPRQTNNPGRTFLPLVRYFAQRNELETFATHLIEAIRDDARLQRSKSLDQLFEALGQAHGACQAIGRAVSAPRSVDFAQCPAALKMRVMAFVRAVGPVFRDDQARRQALGLLEKLRSGQEPERAGDSAPAPRLIAPSAPRVSAADGQLESGR